MKMCLMQSLPASLQSSLLVVHCRSQSQHRQSQHICKHNWEVAKSSCESNDVPASRPNDAETWYVTAGAFPSQSLSWAAAFVCCGLTVVSPTIGPAALRPLLVRRHSTWNHRIIPVNVVGPVNDTINEFDCRLPGTILRLPSAGATSRNKMNRLTHRECVYNIPSSSVSTAA